jgi:hypothetical protein
MAEFLDRCKVRNVTLGDREHRHPQAEKALASAQASYAAMLADPRTTPSTGCHTR